MVLRWMCKSKIHRATVTDANLNYEGSLTLDPLLMAAADLLPGERVQVVNVNNGARLETYVIEGQPDSGQVCLNGPAARLGAVGDTVIVIAYAMMDDADARSQRVRVVHVNERNQVSAPVAV